MYFAGRVSHFGFTNNNATEGWTNTAWTAYDEANPNPKDEAINLNFLFDFLDPGASVSFSFVYILNVADLLTAMGQVCECPPSCAVLDGFGTLSVKCWHVCAPVRFYVTHCSPLRS